MRRLLAIFQSRVLNFRGFHPWPIRSLGLPRWFWPLVVLCIVSDAILMYRLVTLANRR